MAQPLRGWLDYDRTRLPALSPSQRIDYFEKRVRMVAINPLHRLLENEVHVSETCSALLLCGVSLCCAIEATGKFVNGGRGKNVDKFNAFLVSYMSSAYQSQMSGPLTYGQVLWRHFRNGLAHGFAVCHGGFEGNRGEPYFKPEQIAGYPSLKVNPFALYDDYVAGFDRYLRDLRAAQAGSLLLARFDAVFTAVFIQGK